MNQLLHKIKNHEKNWFETLVIFIIIISSLTIGLETNAELHKEYFSFFHVFELCVIFFFSFEVILKLTAHYPKPFEYFRNGWNIFDFLIVASSIIPFLFHSNDNAANAVLILRVFRLARVFRVVRVITHLKPLKDLVETLLRSMPSMAYVGLLLMILFYVYAVIGVIMFGENDPVHFGGLRTTFLTLFQIVTGEEWPELLKIQMFGSEIYGYSELNHIVRKPSAQPVFAVIYFVSFILIGAMIILNLFIAIIVNKMNYISNPISHDHNLETESVILNEIEKKNKEISFLLEKLSQISRKEKGKEE